MDYVNEPPRQEQKGAAKPADRKLCQLVLLTFGVMCIVQATLNVSLRLTAPSSKVSTQSNCNVNQSGDQIQTAVEQKCKNGGPTHCNTLQESFNALTAEKNLLQNQNTELNNQIRNLRQERNRLTKRLKELSQRCPENWMMVNSRCYFLSNESKTWEVSRRFCQREGADLVVIGSEQEQKDLYRLNGDKYLVLWIGLNRTNGTFVWVDGSVLTQTFWQTGQPGDGGPNNKEDCVEMYHANPPLLNWNDAPCGHKLRWLCETDPQ